MGAEQEKERFSVAASEAFPNAKDIQLGDWLVQIVVEVDGKPYLFYRREGPGGAFDLYPTDHNPDLPIISLPAKVEQN